MQKPSFFARYGFLIVLITALLFFPMGLGAWLALRGNANDVQDWLPAEYPETTSFLWFKEHFAGEQFILVSWDGCNFEDQRLPLLVQKLVATEDAKPTETQRLFSKAITGPQLVEQLTQEPINLTREEALERLSGSLVGEKGQTTCAVLTLSEIGVENLGSRAQREQRNKERVKQGEAKNSLHPVETVRRVAIDECNIPEASLHMGGPPVDNTSIDIAGESSLFRLAGLAAAVGLVVSWWCLRSPRLIAMVFIVGIYSAGLSLAIVAYTGIWTGVHMNAILMTMPSLVYVAAISGAIHLSNYYRDTVAEDGQAGAPGRSLRHAALPLGLATGTTAIGLFSLWTSELVPIKLFGLFSGVGVVASLVVLCLFLPSAFQMWPIAQKTLAKSEEAVSSGANLDRRSPWWKVARLISYRNVAVSIACVVLMVAMGWGMAYMQTSVQLMRMFPPGSRILTDYTWLEKNLGRLVPLEVVVQIDQRQSSLSFLDRMELIDRLQAQIEELPEVGRSLSAVTFAPPLPNPDQYRAPGGFGGAVTRMIGAGDVNARARFVRNRRLLDHREDFAKGGYLADENGKDLWRISARVWALEDIDYEKLIEKVQAAVEREIGGTWVDREQNGMVVRALAAGKAGDADAPDAPKQAGIEVVYTGLVPLVYKAQSSLLDGLLWGFVLDLVVVTIVMMIAVREWTAGLILALPSIFPVVVVFGLMGWMGIIIDAGTVMAPAVALGVTVDDVVHFMLMYRGGLKRGLSRRQSVNLAYKGCARAMYQSWGVIGVGLSVFALSPFTPTQRFGYMMVALLSAALIGNLVLLPAVLMSPLGALFGRRYQKQRGERNKVLQPVPAAPVTQLAPAMHRMVRHEGASTKVPLR